MNIFLTGKTTKPDLFNFENYLNIFKHNQPEVNSLIL